jgi:hypothetical protein
MSDPAALKLAEYAQLIADKRADLELQIDEANKRVFAEKAPPYLRLGLLDTLHAAVLKVLDHNDDDLNVTVVRIINSFHLYLSFSAAPESQAPEPSRDANLALGPVKRAFNAEMRRRTVKNIAASYWQRVPIYRGNLQQTAEGIRDEVEKSLRDMEHLDGDKRISLSAIKSYLRDLTVRNGQS